MSEQLTWVIGGLCLVVAAWAAVACWRGRPFDDPLFYACSTVEVAFLVQLASGLVALAGTGRDVDAATFVSYLVTAVVLPPASVLWAVSDRSRWGTGVIAVMGLVQAVLALRLLDIWVAAGD